MRRIFVSLIFILFIGVLIIFAQDEDKQPQARMRVHQSCQSANKCYAVEIYMPKSLRQAEYDALVNNDASKPKIAVIFNSKAMPQYSVQISDKDALLAPARRGRLFVMYLPKDFPIAKPSLLIFMNYPIANDKDDLVFPSIPVETDFNTGFEFDNYNKIFRQKIVLKDKPFDCENTDVGCQSDVAALQLTYRTYLLSRRAFLASWFSGLKQNLSNIQLRVEDLTKCLEINGKGCITYDEWGRQAASLNRPQLSQPTTRQELVNVLAYLSGRGVTNLPPPPSTPPTPDETVKIIRALEEYVAGESGKFAKSKILTIDNIEPEIISKIDPRIPVNTNSFNMNSLEIFSPILVDFYTEKPLPSKFNVQLVYGAPPGQPPIDVPFEVAKTFKKIGAEIAQVVVNPAADTKNVGERDLPDNLDFAILFGSSVEEKEEEVNGVITKVRKRVTRATFDIRLQPLNPEPLIGEDKYIQWTPIYLDAKVSTGKIDTDTLSLNRVVFGTRFDFTKFLRFKNSVGTNPTYLNLNAHFVQASDRDFRQLEYKGVFEFQPRLAFLNRIPANFASTVNKVIKAPDDQLPFREVPPSRGYKIQPFVGGEIGKTWFRRRPAAVIEPTDFIRRLYVGFDATFYLSESASLNFVDKYYFSFGKNVDKKENYFKGTLDFGLRKRNGFGDSFFISFEKGNQPPFNTPDVNALKIGYRFVNPRFTLF